MQASPKAKEPCQLDRVSPPDLREEEMRREPVPGDSGLTPLEGAGTVPSLPFWGAENCSWWGS